MGGATQVSYSRKRLGFELLVDFTCSSPCRFFSTLLVSYRGGLKKLRTSNNHNSNNIHVYI